MSIQQAYKHLETEAMPGYARREDGDMVALIFARTGVVRLFRKLETVGNWYSLGVYRTSVYTSAEQMAKRMTDTEIRRVVWRYGGAKRDAHHDLKGLELARVAWTYLQERADKVERDWPQQDKPSSDQRKYKVDVAKLKSSADVIAKFPRQCRVVAEEMSRLASTSYTDDEIASFARQLHISGKLKTKQDPERIVRYYLPTLAEYGFVDYSSRRVREDGEET